MPLSAPTALDRLDDFRREERCAQDLIAEVISERLYGRHYDKVPAPVQARIEAVLGADDDPGARLGQGEEGAFALDQLGQRRAPA